MSCLYRLYFPRSADFLLHLCVSLSFPFFGCFRYFFCTRRRRRCRRWGCGHVVWQGVGSPGFHGGSSQQGFTSPGNNNSMLNNNQGGGDAKGFSTIQQRVCTCSAAVVHALGFYFLSAHIPPVVHSVGKFVKKELDGKVVKSNLRELTRTELDFITELL